MKWGLNPIKRGEQTNSYRALIYVLGRMTLGKEKSMEGRMNVSTRRDINKMPFT